MKKRVSKLCKYCQKTFKLFPEQEFHQKECATKWQWENSHRVGRVGKTVYLYVAKWELIRTYSSMVQASKGLKLDFQAVVNKCKKKYLKPTYRFSLSELRGGSK